MPSRPGPGRPPAVGAQAPAFLGETLSGRRINVPADYKGKLLLLDFWATWCGPCLAELPHLVKVHEQFGGRGLDILGISLDAPPQTSATSLSRFVQQKKMAWDHVQQGAAEIAARYGVTGIPAAFLIDGDSGAVLAAGDDLRGPRLTATLERHLAGRSSTAGHPPSGDRAGGG